MSRSGRGSPAVFSSSRPRGRRTFLINFCPLSKWLWGGNTRYRSTLLFTSFDNIFSLFSQYICNALHVNVIGNYLERRGNQRFLLTDTRNKSIEDYPPLFYDGFNSESDRLILPASWYRSINGTFRALIASYTMFFRSINFRVCLTCFEGSKLPPRKASRAGAASCPPNSALVD